MRVTNAIGVLLAHMTKEVVNQPNCPRNTVIELAPLIQKWTPNAHYAGHEMATYKDIPIRCLAPHIGRNQFDAAEASYWRPTYGTDKDHVLSWHAPFNEHWKYKSGQIVTYKDEYYWCVHSTDSTTPPDVDTEHWVVTNFDIY